MNYNNSVRRTFILIIIAVTFLCHSSYIPNGFTWLDHGDIEEKRAIVPISSWSTIFTHRFANTEFYRPIVTIVHSLDAAIYGKWAQGYHLTNVILQTIAAVTAYFFLETIFSASPSESFVGALIFGIHPLSFLPVGAIAYRQELLLACGLFMTVALHERTRTSKKSIYPFLSVISFLFTLWSKETAIVLLPGCILLWEWHSRLVRKKTGSIFFWYCGLIIGYVGLRWLAVPEWWHTAAVILPWSESVGTRVSAVGRLLLFLVMPATPPLSDATLLVGITRPTVLWSAIGISSLGIWCYRQGHRGQMLALLLILLLLPALNLVPLPRYSSPHYGYLATVTVGPFLVLLTKSWGTTIVRLSAGCLLILFGHVTFLAGPTFRNDQTIFSSEVRRDPQFLEGHFYLGTAAWKQGDIATADREFTAASRRDPRFIAYVDRTALAINQAGIQVAQGKLQEAEALLLPLAGTSPLVSYNLAVLADRRGDSQRVVALLQEDAFTLHRPEALLLLAKGYAQTGNTTEAVRILRTLGMPSAGKQAPAR